MRRFLLSAAILAACSPSHGQAPAQPVEPPARATQAPARPVQPLPPGAKSLDDLGRPVFPSTPAGIKARKRWNYQAQQAREAQESAAWAAYVEKMGPIVAAQQRQAWLDQQFMLQVQLDASRTQSLSRMADAEAKQAEINRQRLQLQMYEAYRNQR